MKKAQTYSITERVRKWFKRVNFFKLLNGKKLEASMIRLMREAYKQGQKEAYQAGYDAGLMAGERRQNK